MNKILKYTLGCILVWTFASCQSDNQPSLADDGLVEMKFSLPGNYGNPFLPSSRSDYDYTQDLSEYTPHNLPKGSTVWLLLEEQGVTPPADPIVRSFEVDEEGELQPCTVNENGELIERTTYPLFLKSGSTYRARVVGPARKFVEGGYKLEIKNNQYVYAHDNRYDQTKETVFPVEGTSAIERIKLNPIINQTAELKFTIKAKVEKYGEGSDAIEYSPVHSLEVMPAGVVITGLQDYYSLNEKDAEGNYIGEPYNWTLGTEYLRARPGDVNNYMTIYEPEPASDPNAKYPELVFKGAILPTDAVATPIIVGFYLRVNGVPTQFQMMLNRKLFLNAYYYHYKGEVTIQNGITVLEWQTVARDLGTIDLPVITPTL